MLAWFLVSTPIMLFLTPMSTDETEWWGVFCSIFKFQGVVALFLQASCRTWQRGLSCGVLPAVLRSGSFSLVKGLPTIRAALRPAARRPRHTAGPWARVCRFAGWRSSSWSSWTMEAGNTGTSSTRAGTVSPCPGVAWLTRAPSASPRGPRDASPWTAP